MKLKDRNLTPVGGYYYDDPILKRRFTTDGSFRKLLAIVRSAEMAQGIFVENLEAFIEDQICQRQPPGRCMYTAGLGDIISKVVNIAASQFDKFAGTKLASTAASCSGCGHRRVVLNNLTSKVDSNFR